MKKKIIFFLFYFLLTACAKQAGNNDVVQNIGSSSINNSTISIEVVNSPSKSDLYQQIIWTSGGVGGEGGSMPSSRVNCSSCDIDNIFSNEATLHGFLPNQKLKLVIYSYKKGTCDNIGNYFQSYNVTVNSTGKLHISFTNKPDDTFIYSVYDRESGKLEWQWRVPLIEKDCQYQNTQSQSEFQCENDIYTRIRVGDQARVTYTNGIDVNLRLEPILKSSTWITQFSEGTKMRVLNGPACNEGYVWWFVQSGSHKGWIAEGTSNNWFIEPYEN